MSEDPAELIAGLIERLDGAGLTEAEGAALDAVLTRAAAADSEVEGFNFIMPPDWFMPPAEAEPSEPPPGVRHDPSAWQRALGISI